MKKLISLVLLLLMAFLSVEAGAAQGRGKVFDLRGTWSGKAKGSIFGAEGTVTVVRQRGEDIYGIVEGGNFLGTAKFSISGKIRGNLIVGEKEGNVFQGFLYADGTIRGVAKTVDGESYRVFLRRAQPMWGQGYYGGW
jgi:hypothetical protein